MCVFVCTYVCMYVGIYNNMRMFDINFVIYIYIKQVIKYLTYFLCQLKSLYFNTIIKWIMFESF